jgi:hypothetical protein
MTAARVRKPARVRPAAAASEPQLCGCGLRVDADERLHLIRACAFFRADRFREAEPGSVRGEDLRKAARDVDTALRGRKRSRKR